MCINRDKQLNLVRPIVQEFCATKRSFCSRDVSKAIAERHPGQETDHVSSLVRMQYLIGAMPEGYIMQMMRVPHPNSSGFRTFCVYRYSRYNCKHFYSVPVSH